MSVHEVNKAFRCEMCGKIFSRKTNMTTWYQFMKERSHSNVKCVRKALLLSIPRKKNISAVHEEMKTFKCKIFFSQE